MLRFTTLVPTLRGLLRSPLFSLTVILSLAFGIGGNAAIFSIVNALFLHPAGVADPQRVVAPRVTYRKLHLDHIDVSVPDFTDVRESREVFSAAALASISGMNYTGGDLPQRIEAAAVSAPWFDVLGARPLVGRAFRSEDDQPGANHVVVLSYDLWQRLFGGQTSVIGKVMELNREPYRVVGVMPANFKWPSQADLWSPLGLPKKAYAPEERFNEFYTAIARLQPGVSVAQAERFMGILTQRAKGSNKRLAAFANDSQWSMELESFTQLVSGDVRGPLLVLAFSVGLVLLIACSNVAALMLVRGTRRARELAIRRALGASTGDLVSLTMTEVLLLAATGTLLGLLSISTLLRILLWLAPARLTSGLVIQPDSYVVVFTIAAGVLAALLFGAVPAWQASQLGNTHTSLKEGGRAETASARKQRIRGMLVAGQIALALLLLLGTGALLENLRQLRSTHLGFDPNHVLTAAVALPDRIYGDNEKQAAFYRAVVYELKASPGVATAAAAEPIPFNGDNWTGSFEIQGRPQSPGDPGPHGYRGYVSPDYFRALHIPLREGRFFTDADGRGSELVTIVDASLARMYWPREDPIGKRLRNGENSPWTTVVGVVDHVRAYDFSARDTRGIYYMPVYQQPVSAMNFVVRAEGDPERLAGVIARAVHKFDPSQAVFDIATPPQRIAKALGTQQFASELLTAFALAAIALAALGLYGVVSFSAGQRTKEIGIRSALGASRREILVLMVGEGIRLVLAGTIAGAVVSIYVLRSLASQFEGLAIKFETLVAAVAILSVVTLAATLIPAWRSATSDALTALRSE